MQMHVCVHLIMGGRERERCCRHSRSLRLTSVSHVGGGGRAGACMNEISKISLISCSTAVRNRAIKRTFQLITRQVLLHFRVLF